MEAKQAVTPATLGAAVARLRHLVAVAGRPASLVTDYLTPPVTWLSHSLYNENRWWVTDHDFRKK